jgi:hypothetical protein
MAKKNNNKNGGGIAGGETHRMGHGQGRGGTQERVGECGEGGWVGEGREDQHRVGRV